MEIFLINKMVTLNPAKLGMVMKFAIDDVNQQTNYNTFTQHREDFKQLVLEYYLLASDCEEYIKKYDPTKKTLKYEE